MSAETTVITANAESNKLGLKNDKTSTSILEIFDWSSIGEENEKSR